MLFTTSPLRSSWRRKYPRHEPRNYRRCGWGIFSQLEALARSTPSKHFPLECYVSTLCPELCSKNNRPSKSNSPIYFSLVVDCIQKENKEITLPFSLPFSAHCKSGLKCLRRGQKRSRAKSSLGFDSHSPHRYLPVFSGLVALGGHHALITC